MYKFILVVAVVALTACGSAKTEEASTADSTAVAAPVADTTATDSTVVAAPTTGEAAK
jgi:hypothetical protein